MTWLNNTTAKCNLVIGTTNYSPELSRINLSDQTILGTGVITTGGTIELIETLGGHRLEDYSKTKFLRGTAVTIDLVVGGVTRRHPRGKLLVLDSSYNPESKSVSITVGCLLSLYQITDNIENLRSYTIFDLPDDANFSQLSSAIASEQRYIYVDKNGVIQKKNFFGTDGLGSNKEAAAWVAVRDYTCLASAPLGTGQLVPDKIVVTYTYGIQDDTVDPEDPDFPTRYDEDLTESTYWLEHPAQIKTLQRVCSTNPAGTVVCEDVYVNDAKKTFSVTKTDRNVRYYGGPGGSTSTEVSITEGPAVEMNGSYFAELYSWELARANGDNSQVSLKGLETVVQQRREKTYEYGSGGEVLRTVQRSYKNYVSAMTQNDWRDTAAAETLTVYDPLNPPTTTLRGFLTSPPLNDLYLDSEVTETYEYYDDKTVQITVTKTSSASCNGVGIYPPTGDRVLLDISALNNGNVETVKRTNRSSSSNPDQPPRDPGGVSTVTKAGTVEDISSKFLPTSAGSVVYNTNVPYTNLTDTEAQARNRAVNYASYIRNLIEGDAAGIRVAESMRPEIFNYYPGMPYTYYDRTEGKLIKLRMNQTSWAISNEDAIMGTDGIFIGVSDGTVSLGSNT